MYIKEFCFVFVIYWYVLKAEQQKYKIIEKEVKIRGNIEHW